MAKQPAVWFPAVQAGTGADVFTERLAAALERRGLRTAVTWLPHRAEFAPWSVQAPEPPQWANLAHCNSWLHASLIPTGLPLVATIHGCVHDPAFDPYKRRAQSIYHRLWIRRVEANTLNRADCVTAVSRYTAIRSEETFRRSGIVSIHNWIDTETFLPLPRQEPGDPFRLLFVGNPSRRKGADLLPTIMRRLGPQFVLHYTGTEGDLRTDADLPPNMLPLGWINDTAALVHTYQTSDALLFPTRLEGLSLSALEALACGLPVIASDSSSMPELVRHGDSGLLCPMDDTDAFVDAARQLRGDRELWLHIRARAHERAREFSEAAALDRYIEIYASLLSR